MDLKLEDLEVEVIDLTEVETEEIYCYCCEEFQPHIVFEGQDENKFYECVVCSCTIDDAEEEVIRPQQKSA